MADRKKSQSGNKKVKRNFLLLEFSLLSFISFLIIGLVVGAAVEPALESFTLDNQKNTTVVFANKLASRVLTEEDFQYPLTPAQTERMREEFIRNLNIRGVLRIFITDSEGTVVYAQPEEFIGVSFIDNSDVSFAISHRRATAHFENITSEEQETLGVKEALIEAVPITFSGSDEVKGVVYIISRVGLLRKQISETQQNIVTRVFVGLAVLYLLLLVVVWRASRTIRRQAGELASYARTLEDRVRQRTRDLEKSLGKQIKQAKELARLKDEFVFIAAHELRAPVTSLSWGLDAFLHKKSLKKKDDPDLFDLVQLMKKATHALANLVNDLLGVARLESGAVKVAVHPTSLIAVLQDLVPLFEAEAKRKGIRLELSYDKTRTLPFALSDSERLKEVFSNLLSNALKYNSRGGRVEVSVVQDGDFLEARVVDTGIGMTEDELFKLFTKFWRANPKIPGTGLGLWIAKELVERMGGELIVESQKGQGTSFTVRLPVAKKEGVHATKKNIKKKKA